MIDRLGMFTAARQAAGYATLPVGYTRKNMYFAEWQFTPGHAVGSLAWAVQRTMLSFYGACTQLPVPGKSQNKHSWFEFRPRKAGRCKIEALTGSVYLAQAPGLVAALAVE